MSTYIKRLRKVIILPKGFCWEWTGCRSSNGYGHIRTQDGIVTASRYFYEHIYGKKDRKLDICHTCDNRLCVRPSHLFIGTRADNLRDMYKKGRSNNILYTGRKIAAKLTVDNIIEIRLLYSTTNISHRELAQKYGVVKGTISFILNGATWKGI